MKPDVEQLHVAARRYCIDRAGLWAERFQRLVEAGAERSGSRYTPEAYRTFPRYQVLNAIRVELERLTGTDVGNLDEARDLFALAGFIAENTFTSYEEPEAQGVAQDEREAFAKFVREVPAALLHNVAPLPYTRVISSVEAEQVWDALERAWGLERRQCWYPLANTSHTDVEAFRTPYFGRAISAEHLGNSLAERGISRVWELREYGPEYELDVQLVDPRYNLSEGIWTSRTFDWIVYASHEGSITVGGWVLSEVKRLWPEWERHIWRNSFECTEP
jgi:hypothetical protein